MTPREAEEYAVIQAARNYTPSSQGSFDRLMFCVRELSNAARAEEAERGTEDRCIHGIPRGNPNMVCGNCEPAPLTEARVRDIADEQIDKRPTILSCAVCDPARIAEMEKRIEALEAKAIIHDPDAKPGDCYTTPQPIERDTYRLCSYCPWEGSLADLGSHWERFHLGQFRTPTTASHAAGKHSGRGADPAVHPGESLDTAGNQSGSSAPTAEDDAILVSYRAVIEKWINAGGSDPRSADEVAADFTRAAESAAEARGEARGREKGMDDMIYAVQSQDFPMRAATVNFMQDRARALLTPAPSKGAKREA